MCLKISKYTFVLCSVNTPDEATVSLTTFIFTTVGVSAVAMVALVVGFAMCIFAILACRRQQPTSRPNITRSLAPLTSSAGGEVSAGVTPEYEEISLHEVKDIHLTDNDAYGCKS